MAWIYFQESEASELPLVHGSEQSHIVKESLTAKLFCCPECQQTTLIELQSGTMLEPCTKDCCRQLILFLEDFPAKTSALRELEKAWMESEAVYSTKLSGLQKKFDQVLFSLKMSQPLELEDWKKLSKHLPKSGMTVAGRVYLPQALELHTKGKGGSYLPTPTASNYGHNQSNSKGSKIRHSLAALWKKGLLPTITVSQKSYDRQANGGITLSMSGLWKETYGTTLPAAFVEWMMGYRLKHTELKPWATQWFRFKRKQLLKS